MTNKPLFVFMDESGRKESDPYFVCGFLEIEDNQAFSVSLQRVYDQIKNLSIRNRIARVDLLKKRKNINELYNLARTYNEFELKHYRISQENQILYCDLIKVLFKKTKFRFTAIVADRSDRLYERDPLGQFPLYLKAFKLYTSYCVRTPDYIFVPDSFEPGFDWNVKNGNLPMSIFPLDSKSCLQLQVTDILSGLTAQALKLEKRLKRNNKDVVRQPVLDTLEKELGRKINSKFTVNKPVYFNVWRIDWSKTKRSGHGQETQPRP
ncbi:MAG: DUF3800 domain-containing protein [Candidatus Woesebacteria bacterium]|nr:DUF3800 domain-containing protein [Candidatus Woesebacteria bacterium]